MLVDLHPDKLPVIRLCAEALDLIEVANRVGMTSIGLFSSELAAAIERVEDAARGVG